MPNIWLVNQYKEAHDREADAIKRAKVWVNFIPSDFTPGVVLLGGCVVLFYPACFV